MLHVFTRSDSKIQKKWWARDYCRVKKFSKVFVYGSNLGV